MTACGSKNDGTGSEQIIGEPSAELSLPVRAKPTFDEVFGCMLGTVTVAPGVDLAASTSDDDWEEEMLKDWDEQNR